MIVAQNLVAARYVQLAPAYASSGPTMADGAVIPRRPHRGSRRMGRGQDPIDAPGNRSGAQARPAGLADLRRCRFIDSAANALATATATKLRQTLAQLSGVGRILADGSGNIVDIIKNLQTFVTALRDSNEQIVSFQNRLATLTSVLNDSRSDLDAALTRSVGGRRRGAAVRRGQPRPDVRADCSGWPTSPRISSTTAGTWRTCCTSRPTRIANGYNMYNPDTRAPLSVPSCSTTSPIRCQFVCGAIGAVENVTAPKPRSCAPNTLAPRCGC